MNTWNDFLIGPEALNKFLSTIRDLNKSRCISQNLLNSMKCWWYISWSNILLFKGLIQFATRIVNNKILKICYLRLLFYEIFCRKPGRNWMSTSTAQIHFMDMMFWMSWKEMASLYTCWIWRHRNGSMVKYHIYSPLDILCNINILKSGNTIRYD